MQGTVAGRNTTASESGDEISHRLSGGCGRGQSMVHFRSCKVNPRERYAPYLKFGIYLTSPYLIEPVSCGPLPSYGQRA